MKLTLLSVMLYFSCSSLCAQEVILKSYDTEFGRFNLWIKGNQVSGSYEIKPKEIIGSIWATLDGPIATGRWIDPDGSGDIILNFEAGFDRFRADYRGDKDPETWYRDQWHGTSIQTKPTSSTNKGCESPSHTVIQPFIGVWEEFSLNEEGKETFIGTLEVALEAGGCALNQQFISADSSFFYATLGFVNEASGFWEETYVFSTGRISEYQWIIDNGEIVQRKIGGSRSSGFMHQLRFTKLTSEGYLLIQERSDNGGKTWVPGEQTRVKRKR